MVANQNLEYVEQIVAFVDILGFSSLIDKIETDEKSFRTLHWALSHIQSYKHYSEMGDTAQSDLEVSVFSDCIVVTSALHHWHSVIWAVGWLQAQLLGGGILTRGGISRGKVFHSDGILYGSGMLKAYNIENSAAVYPRIVIDPDLITSFPERIRSTFLSMDLDGLWFIDPFSFNATTGNSDVLLEDGWDPHEVYLEEVGRHIAEGIKTAKRVDHKSKWTWLSVKHSIAKDSYLNTGETRLTRLLKRTP